MMPSSPANVQTPLRLLVIGNAPHHSKSILFLVREVMRLDPSIRATVVCYGAQHALFASMIGDAPIDILPFEGGAPPAASSTPAADLDGRVSRTPFLKSVLRLKRGASELSRKAPAVRAVVELLKESLPGQVLRERTLVARLREEKRMAEQIFERVQPTVVVAFGDRHPDIEAPILLVARQRGIKVVVPYTSYSGKDILVQVRKDDPLFAAAGARSLYRRAKARRFHGQVHEGLFYQPPHILAAYEEAGALSSYPWCLGNGLSDAICVDSEVTAERYRRDKVAPAKLRIVGDVVYDKVADIFHRRGEIRSGLCTKYRFDSSRRLIIVALPQLAEQGVLDWETHWREMRFLVAALCRTGENVLISLHPRCKPADYAFLESEYPCRIADERLADFVSAADVFVANYSSTVVWAVLCGIRTVVVDFYGLNYRFFDYLQSVLIIRDRGELDAAMANAVHGPAPDFSADWAALSRDQVLDGNTMQRYLGLLRELSRPAGAVTSCPVI